MVFALAGDSTMTRRRSATGALFGSDDRILPGRSAGCARHHSERCRDTASVRNGRYWHGRCPRIPVRAGRISLIGGAQLPRAAPRLPRALAGASNGCPPTAATSSRPTISRTSTPGRSGWRSSRGATSASWRSPSCSGSRSGRSSRACGAFPVRRGAARPGGGRDRDPALPRRAHRRHVPRGHAPREGAAEEARGTLALRRRPDRARGGGAARPGRDLGHRRSSATSARCASRSATRSRSTTSRTMPLDDAAQAATDRLSAAITELEESLS